VPPALAGEDNPRNVAYVPPDCLGAKSSSPVRCVQAALIERLEIVSEFRGDSFVPRMIRIIA
jgi:hypothetical protein